MLLKEALYIYPYSFEARDLIGRFIVRNDYAKAVYGKVRKWKELLNNNHVHLHVLTKWFNTIGNSVCYARQQHWYTWSASARADLFIYIDVGDYSYQRFKARVNWSWISWLTTVNIVTYAEADAKPLLLGCNK